MLRAFCFCRIIHVKCMLRASISRQKPAQPNKRVDLLRFFHETAPDKNSHVLRRTFDANRPAAAPVAKCRANPLDQRLRAFLLVFKRKASYPLFAERSTHAGKSRRAGKRAPHLRNCGGAHPLRQCLKPALCFRAKKRKRRAAGIRLRANPFRFLRQSRPGGLRAMIRRMHACTQNPAFRLNRMAPLTAFIPETQLKSVFFAVLPECLFLPSVPHGFNQKYDSDNRRNTDKNDCAQRNLVQKYSSLFRVIPLFRSGQISLSS